MPKDWGGENNDVFTTALRIGGKRRRAAFALKGPAKTGPLVPGKMGKNGDQIQRLFNSPAEVFFVQYEGEIKESVVEQMERLALARSFLASEVLYGVIDEADTRAKGDLYGKLTCAPGMLWTITEPKKPMRMSRQAPYTRYRTGINSCFVTIVSLILQPLLEQSAALHDRN